MVGSQPTSVRAFVMSGQRRFGIVPHRRRAIDERQFLIRRRRDHLGEDADRPLVRVAEIDHLALRAFALSITAISPRTRSST